MVFHVINRGVGRRRLFGSRGDYAAFERVLQDVVETVPMRILSYCLMPNHWHLLLWPQVAGQLASFMQRLTTTHVRRFQQHRQEIGHGHLYQGRFKSFPVQEDSHFLTVARYVERNALRAKLAARAEDWRWCSLWRREHGSPAERGLLCEWPVPRQPDWLNWVNQPQTEKEIAALRLSINRSRPYGEPAWQQNTAQRLGLQRSFGKPGRPKKMAEVGEWAHAKKNRA
jgi:putative transposase